MRGIAPACDTNHQINDNLPHSNWCRRIALLVNYLCPSRVPATRRFVVKKKKPGNHRTSLVVLGRVILKQQIQNVLQILWTQVPLNFGFQKFALKFEKAFQGLSTVWFDFRPIFWVDCDIWFHNNVLVSHVLCFLWLGPLRDMPWFAGWHQAVIHCKRVWWAVCDIWNLTHTKSEFINICYCHLSHFMQYS